MTLEGLIANWRDLSRLKRLERAGHFRPGFALECRLAALRYLLRIVELKLMNRPQTGPIVST